MGVFVVYFHSLLTIRVKPKPQVSRDAQRFQLLADVAAEVLFNNIPESLIIYWDQTGLSIVPTRDWTMEKEDAKIVPICS